MHQKTGQSGITFAVDDVAPATKPLPERRMHEALRATLRTAAESCCDYHGLVVRGVNYQPLLAAVYTAFNEHRPLILSPDAVWITIAQGVGHHMMVHGEELRSRFVSHQGKLELSFECSDWVEGSPENPWREAFASWADQIRDHVGQRVHDTLVCDFSTTGPLERSVSQIVMMDNFQRYFEYVVLGICGIPSITLEGTPADWDRLVTKASALEMFDIDWWLVHLLPICEQFARASRGDVDLTHWQSICKLRQEYGGDVINGWVARLFPYLRSFVDGPCNRRNPIFETGEGFQTLVAPPGLSRVPFVWRRAGSTSVRRMEAIGGLIGVSQDSETLALRPKVGWAVREANKIDVLLARLSSEHTTFPGQPIKHDSDSRLDLDRLHEPPDLAEFYHRTNGADLFGGCNAGGCRIVASSEIEPLDWGDDAQSERITHLPGGRNWHRFAWLADGTWLAINLDPFCADPRPGADRRKRGPEFRAICHGSRETQGRPGQNPVIALSFTELLERMLESGRAEYWLDPGFTSPGDAEQFTNRPDPQPSIPRPPHLPGSKSRTS